MNAVTSSRYWHRLAIAAVILTLTAVMWPTSAEAAWIGWYEYRCNGTNTNGTLTWKYTWDDNPPVHSVARRAGSGLYLNDNTNGWLPSGWYAIRGHWNTYWGTKIFGRVWYLSDKVNPHGVLRYGLFIHTEETPYNGQYNPTSGDDPQCWEGVIDYRSEGCIKLAYPYDIDLMHWYWNDAGGTAAHGNTYPYPMWSRLYVVTG